MYTCVQSRADPLWECELIQIVVSLVVKPCINVLEDHATSIFTPKLDILKHHRTASQPRVSRAKSLSSWRPQIWYHYNWGCILTVNRLVFGAVL